MGRYTGADLAAVVRQAALAALDEDLACAAVADCHFRLALQVLDVRLPGTQQGGSPSVVIGLSCAVIVSIGNCWRARRT